MKINRFKTFFVERVSDNIQVSFWKAHCYTDYMTRQRVVALVGLHFIIGLCFYFNLFWSEWRGQASWIDREVYRRHERLSEAERELSWRRLMQQVNDEIEKRR